jgi:16S rRNA (adenine1518-N6/adenine1519-N6)-dimethyltransferase
VHETNLDCAPPFEEPFTVVGNFPYNISSQILFRVLEWKDQVPVMVGMFQKEVAKRIVSGPGNKDYGILSVLVQAYYHAEYLFDVPPESFNPPPKVDSGVIKLTRRSDVVDMRSEKSFIGVVKAAFGQRRKMLRNPLKGMFTPEILQEDIFTKRPEQLSVSDFAALTFKMK